MGVTQPLYTRDILRLASSIPDLARFEEVGATPLRSPTCGSRIAARATLDDDGKVVTYTQAVEACAFGQAAAALVGQRAIGTDLAAAKAALAGVEGWLGGSGGEPWPGLAALEPARARKARHGAILLPFRALLSAIEQAQ